MDSKIGNVIKKNQKIIFVLIAVIATIIVVVNYLVFYEKTKLFELPQIVPAGILLLALFVIALIGSAVMGCIEKIRLEYVYLVSFFLVGAIYLMVFSPYSTYDEGYHAATIYSYINTADSDHILDESGSVIVRQTDTEFVFENWAVNRETYIKVIELGEQPSDNKPATLQKGLKAMDMPGTAYVPQILGGYLGKIMKANGIKTMYLMKLFALIFSAICGFFAIRIAPVGKSVFVVVSFLPMWLEAAVSFTYDATVNSLSMLVVAYILYLKFEKDSIGIKDYIPLIIMMFLLAPVKIIYFLLTLLVFIVPISKYKNKLYYWICNSATVLLSAGFAVLLRFSWISEVHNYVPPTGGQTYSFWSLGMIFGDIFAAIKVLFDTLITNMGFYITTSVGSVLGWFNLPIPEFIVYICLAIIVFIAVFGGKKSKDYTFQLGDRIIIACTYLLIFFGVIMAMWTGYTPDTERIIQGVHGRYFLPILPVLMILCRTRKLVISDEYKRVVPFLMVLINTMAVKGVLYSIL